MAPYFRGRCPPMLRVPFALRLTSAVQWLVMWILLNLEVARCQPQDDCVLSLTKDLVHVLSDCYIMLDGTEANHLLQSLNISAVYAREPINWLPHALRVQIPSSAHILLLGVRISIPSCEILWKMVERECTYLLSSTWPSPFLETGPAFLYFRRLSGAESSAERVNITCPTADWDALLAARGSAITTGAPSAPGLAPCGTTIVSSGQQLMEALQRLQPGHARVLVTLETNISLPTEPTSQRLEVIPDDTQPLIAIYRNVTLAGGKSLVYSVSDSSSQGGVELDLRMRRNAFDVVTARRQPRPDQQGGPPMLFLVDLQLVNSAPGPPPTWPLGLLSTWSYFANIDRSGVGGLQILLLRSMAVYTEGEHSYINFWYTSMMSLLPVDRSKSSWLRAIIGGLQMVRDVNGYAAHFGNVMDFFAGYNSSITNVPLRTAPSPADFDLWSIETPSPLPPSTFATARNATQLLARMQESWTSGPRVILLVANITLAPGEWPQGGVSLSYNVTLVGPVAGAPVWLDTGGMALVGSVATVGSNKTYLIFRLLRLRLVGFSPPLLTASGDDVAQAAAQGAFAGSRNLESWRDRCLGVPVSSAGPVSATNVRYEARACVLELPEAHLALLQLYNAAMDCDAYTTSNDTTTVITAACHLLQPQKYAAAPTPNNGILMGLLTGSLKATQGSKISIDTTSSSPALFFSHALLGGVVLSNTTALAITTNKALQEEAPAACGMETLLLALAASLTAEQLTPVAVSPPTVSNHTPRKAAFIGGLVGGIMGGLLATVAAALLIARWWRRRLTHADKPDTGAAIVAIAMTTGEVGGASDGDQVNELAADDGRLVADPEREPGVAMQAESLAFTLTPSEQQMAMGAAGSSFRARCMIGGGPNAAGKPPGPPRLLPQDAEPQRPNKPDFRPAPKPLCAVTELKRDIERVREKCQEVVQSHSPKNSKMRLLGSGGFASVFLTEWCGMWVAVKLLMHKHGDTASARQRLTTEAALTMTLDHPHIVPTYDVAVETLRASDNILVPPMVPAAPVGVGPAAAVPAAEAPDEGEAAPDYATAIRLRLTMQYCEGGTLGAALARGKFAAPPDLVSTSVTPAAGVTAVGPTRPLRWEDLAPAGNMLLSLLAARDVAAALEYLHAAKVVHGDLTENNVLLKAVVPYLPASIQSRSKSTTTMPRASLDLNNAVPNNSSGGGLPDVGARDSEAMLVNVTLAAPAAMEQPQSLHGLWDPALGRGTVVHMLTGRAGKPLSRRVLPAAARDHNAVRPASVTTTEAAAAETNENVRESVRRSCSLSSSSSNSDAGQGSTAPVVGRSAAPCSNTTIPTINMGGWAMRIYQATTSTAPSDSRDAASTGRSTNGTESDTSRVLVALAKQLCRWSFKLSDFGLSVQLQDASQTHMSDRYQGTPVFAAPEVMECGRLSPAADVYSFGVLLWLLLHGVSLKQIRPLLPRILFVRSVGEDLLHHTCNRLPTAAVALMHSCLERDPAQRPPAAQLKSAVEGLLKDAAGPALYQLLTGMERYELLCGRPDIQEDQPIQPGTTEAECGVEAAR